MRSLFPVAALPIIAIFLFGLTGCSLFPKPQSQRTFLLSPLSPVAPEESAPTVTKTRPALTLRLAMPDASAPLNGSNILVMPAPQEYNVYPGVRWRDQAPTLLHEQLIQSFRQHGHWAAVIDDQSRARSDVLLSSYLTAFESRYTQGNPVVVIGLNVQMIDESRLEVLAERYFEIHHPSPDEQVETVVETFGKATDELSRQLIDWTFVQMSEH